MNTELMFSCKTDSEEHYKATEDFARRLIDHAKPQTNADRIRAMSDEELAAVLMKVLYQHAIWCDGNCSPARHCENCLKEWLKQPAEGE